MDLGLTEGPSGSCPPGELLGLRAVGELVHVDEVNPQDDVFMKVSDYVD